MSLPKVTYFDFPGSRGEEVRLALVLAGAPFEDNRIGDAAFEALKPQLPFAALPVFDAPGHATLPQSNAILRLIGRLHGLYPEDLWEGARHDAVLDACEELRMRISGTTDMKDPAEKKAARQALATGFIPLWARGIEVLIGPGPFVFGDRPGVADVKLHMLERGISRGAYDNIPTDILAPFTRLMAVTRGVANHPAVKAWYAPKA